MPRGAERALQPERPPENIEMRNRLISLVLLLVFGCGLIAGPHPCQAKAAVPEAAEAAAEGGCHSHAAPSPVSKAQGGLSVSPGGGEEDCCAGHGALCQTACQSVAIVRAGTLAFAVPPSARAEVLVFEPALPRFAQGIDHIPLA
jgi:hypothetical protein